MTDEQKIHEALKALSTFNTAVTTSRLYPALSPQVANSVEKAYQAIKAYARSYGELALSRHSDGPRLLGKTVPETIKKEIGELVVYRHLELLKLEHLVLRAAFDRKTFSHILTIFTARKEKINREGGGRPFVNSLGLEQHFPDEYQPAAEPVPETPRSDEQLQADVGGISPDLLAYLFGEHRREEVRDMLRRMFKDPQKAEKIVLAGVARALKTLGENDPDLPPRRSADYTTFLSALDKFVIEEKRASLASAAVSRLLEKISDQLLAALLVQKYSGTFATVFFETLIETATNEKFDAAASQLRDLVEQKKGDIGRTEVGTAVEQLLQTRKGKQFLGREKARSLIASGEQDRRDKRLSAGVKAILEGKADSLQNDEIVYGLPDEIGKMLKLEQHQDAARLIERIAAEMLGGDDAQRQKLIRILILIGDLLLENKRPESLNKIVGALLSWVRESDDGDFVYEKSVFLLQAVMNQAWESGNYSRGDQILPVFYKIRTGLLQKPPPIVAIVGRIQDRSFNRPFYAQMLKQHLAEQGDSKAGERLRMLGRPSSSFLIEKLLEEEEPADRLKIIDILSGMGPVVLDVILEKLPEPMRWFGKRNLIKLAKENAGPEHVKAILPFLRHDDIRVQREAFVCIYTISGDERKAALLECLEHSSEAMLSQVVKALLPFSDEETARKIAGLLKDQENFSDKVRESLVLETLKVLARSKSRDARAALKAFLDSRNKKVNRKLPDNIWQNGESALKQLEASLRQAESKQEPEKNLQLETEPEITAPVLDTSDQEQVEDGKQKRDYSQLPGAKDIQELLDQGKKDLAKDTILDLITKMAGARSFAAAEGLREWLIEIDPMSLSEIIRAAEIIEEEKVSSIDQDDIEAWSDLYDVLTTDEFATFFHAMHRKTYANEEIIVRQGDLEPKLFFVNSGKVKVYYRDAEGEILVKNGVRGDILGGETVFDASVWTVSIACLMKAEIYSLGIEQIFEWREEFPSLESKLHDFCMQYASLQRFFKISGKDRRVHKRYNIKGRVISMLLDSQGRDTGISSKGELFDVSAGGVSFFLRISQKKNARLLLGRSIRVMLPMDGVVGKQVSVEGMIIAVRAHQAMENEYSVHVKFEETLSSSKLQGVVKTGGGSFI